MNLEATILERPLLRFGQEMYKKHENPRVGIKMYGPYDYGIFTLSTIKCVLLYHKSCSDIKDYVKNGLVRGMNTFDGISNFFRISLNFTTEASYSTYLELEGHLKNIPNDTNFVIVIIPTHEKQIYKNIKKSATS